MRQITVKEPYRNLRFASEAETPSLRPATQEDEGFLFAVFSASRAREYSCTGWSGSRLDLLLRLQFRAREQSYAERFPDSHPAIVLVGRQQMGCVRLTRF